MQKFLKSLEAKANKSQNIDENAIRYVGLNIRIMANLVDTLLLIILTMPLLFIDKPNLNTPHSSMPPEVYNAIELHNNHQISSEEFKARIINSGYLQQVIIPRMLTYTLINLIVVGALYITAWKLWSSTPGKMLFGVKIVDEKTLAKPSTKQDIIRFLGYIVSLLPLFLGYIMISFNKRRKGLHDYMAGTIVIYTAKLNPELERKKKKWQIYAMMVLLIISIIYLSGKYGG